MPAYNSCTFLQINDVAYRCTLVDTIYWCSSYFIALSWRFLSLSLPHCFSLHLLPVLHCFHSMCTLDFLFALAGSLAICNGGRGAGRARCSTDRWVYDLVFMLMILVACFRLTTFNKQQIAPNPLFCITFFFVFVDLAQGAWRWVCARAPACASFTSTFSQIQASYSFQLCLHQNYFVVVANFFFLLFLTNMQNLCKVPREKPWVVLLPF